MEGGKRQDYRETHRGEERDKKGNCDVAKVDKGERQECKVKTANQNNGKQMKTKER